MYWIDNVRCNYQYKGRDVKFGMFEGYRGIVGEGVFYRVIIWDRGCFMVGVRVIWVVLREVGINA